MSFPFSPMRPCCLAWWNTSEIYTVFCYVIYSEEKDFN